MEKIIYNKYDKHSIADLPRANFPGRIITINTPGETKKAVDYLLSSDIIGVDTETRPSFTRGQNHKVALLQASNRTTCMLFRLNLTDITPDIIRLLEDTTVPKVGLSWHDDLLSLHRRAKFTPGWFIDIQTLAPSIGIEDKSLQKLYANLFHQKISKSQRLTNWEADVLKDPQKLYAATDAWACIMLYEEIQRLARTGEYELVTVPEEQKAETGKKKESTKAEETTPKAEEKAKKKVRKTRRRSKTPHATQGKQTEKDEGTEEK